MSNAKTCTSDSRPGSAPACEGLWRSVCCGVIAFGLLPFAARSQAAASAGGVTTSATGDVNAAPEAKKKTRDEKRAENAYLTGAKLLEHGDRQGAAREFSHAAELAPDNHDYSMAVAAASESRVTELVQDAGKARLMGNDAKAESLLAEARTIDPTNTLLLQHPDPKTIVAPAKVRSWLIDGPRLAGPIALKPKSDLESFHIHSTMPEVIRQVALAYGIKVAVDPTVTNHQVKFDVDDVPYAQAMHIASQMGGFFAVPLTPDSIFVVKDNEENRLKYERLVQETVYAAGMTNEELAEMGNMIRSVFEVKQVSVENSFGTLVIRAPEETLRVLNLTLADMLDGSSQVMIDLKIYSVDKTATTNIGATVPSQAGAYNVASAATALVTANQTIVNQAIAQGLIPAGTSNIEIAALLLQYGLATSTLLSGTLAFIGGGLSTTGVYSNATPTLNFALTSSDTRALDEIQLRVGDRQSATFRAGSKYPITQSTYSTSTAATSAAAAGATVNGVSVASLLAAATTLTIPQVQYEDLGVTLKATPTVQKSGLISLHLDLKIESLAGGTVDNIPILNSNQFTSDVTVADGGTAFLVSNMTRSEAAAITGIPGLSELPGFQGAPEAVKTKDVGQILMVLTPHLVRKRSNESMGPRIPITLPASASAD